MTFEQQALQLLAGQQSRDAESLCRTQLASSEDYLPARYFLGIALHQQLRFQEAFEAFDRVCHQDPENVDALCARAGMLYELGQWLEAAKSYHQAEQQRPDDADIKANLAIVLAAMEQTDAALESYSKALELVPTHAASLINMGALLAKLGRHAEALEVDDRLVAAYPEQAAAWFNRAEVLLSMGQFSECLKNCERALALEPDHLKARFTRVIALVSVADVPRAEQEYRQLLRIDRDSVIRLLAGMASVDVRNPEDVDLWRIYLWVAWQRQIECNWHDRQTLISTYEKLARDEVAVKRYTENLFFPMISLPLSLGSCRTIAGRISATVSQDHPVGASFLPALCDASVKRRRLRIGYLSPKFRESPNARMMLRILEDHNREHFEIFGYATNHEDKDKVDDRLCQAFDAYRELFTESDDEVAAEIRADEIDILVDLAGYSNDSRPGVLSRRAAPLQVTYLGSQLSSGSEFIDYTITDAEILGDTREHWSESIITVPGCAFTINDQFEPASVNGERADHGFSENDFVFCCFHTSHKLEPLVMDSWARIVKQVANGKLWILDRDQRTRQNLEAEFRERGVLERVVFAEPANYEQHHQRMKLADLYLDTFWYNAHTVSVEVLYAGLPLLTCRGRKTASRIAASALKACGLEELITNSIPDYEALAVSLAANPDKLPGYRRHLANRADIPLFDTRWSVAKLEHAYQAIWARYRDGLEPTDMQLDVPR